MSSNGLLLQLTFAALGCTLISGSPANELIRAERGTTETLWAEKCDINLLPKGFNLYYYLNNSKGIHFDFSKPPQKGILFSTKTKILTHGYRENIFTSEFSAVIHEYFRNEDDMNVFSIDWSAFTFGMYRDAATSTHTLGKAVRSILCFLYEYYDIYSFQIHLIGHDLGAHLMGTAARESPFTIGRLTGIDPNTLCFTTICEGASHQPMSKTDAKFVDVIHTNTKELSFSTSLGLTDFYTFDSDEWLSSSGLLYYAESISNRKAVFGRQCESGYPLKNCSSTEGAYWGEYMDNTVRGIYIVRKPDWVAFQGKHNNSSPSHQ